MVCALLGNNPNDEKLDVEIIADGMGEIANILAGQVKNIMNTKGIELSIGMPLFIKRTVTITKNMEAAIRDIHIGTIPASIAALKRTI